MSDPVSVRIFGAPIATCSGGVADTWQNLAGWVRRQMQIRFGEQVEVSYCDLFSPDAERFPEVLQMVRDRGLAVPVVLVGGELLSAGGKISLPAIRRRLEELGLQPR